jgi:NAD(P)-dependent dehydrogenase (short-subunit alcohol dehydrogenase family)
MHFRDTNVQSSFNRATRFRAAAELMRLAGKAALITGASTGIGHAAALRFAREGARLVVADLRDEPGEVLCREIVQGGGEAVYLRTDAASRDDNERAIAHCVDRYGAIDILFCNAGITLPKLLPDSSDAEIERVLGVNLLGAIYAARAAIPRMLAQPHGGTILFTASKTGLVAQTDSPVYCASKGAVVMLAKALALDYATRGIRVNALCPGIIETPMLREFADTRPDPAAAWRSYEAAQPIGRLGTPEECADAALWLVSDEASFITGVALPVDGGFTAM